jgi:serine phosphatase RsbU (regulator of sigma subunit)
MKIQKAMLPETKEFQNHFEDSFILYQPKDIISGDFYWFTKFDGYSLFVCADCTGHGVPGALMSMIGINLIEHIVAEKEVSSPDGALHELDRKIRIALKQENDPDQKDGMDIAFCSFHPQKLILHYGGANRPLILVRNGNLEEIEASKFGIGGLPDPAKKFIHHKF